MLLFLIEINKIWKIIFLNYYIEDVQVFFCKYRIYFHRGVWKYHKKKINQVFIEKNYRIFFFIIYFCNLNNPVVSKIDGNCILYLLIWILEESSLARDQWKYGKYVSLQWKLNFYSEKFWGVPGRVVRVFDFESLAPHQLWITRAFGFFPMRKLSR